MTQMSHLIKTPFNFKGPFLNCYLIRFMAKHFLHGYNRARQVSSLYLIGQLKEMARQQSKRWLRICSFFGLSERQTKKNQWRLLTETIFFSPNSDLD